jgi:hypothetical protein
VDVVPRVFVGGSNDEQGKSTTSSNIMEGLLTMLLSDRYTASVAEAAEIEHSPEADALREQIRKDMEKKK